MPEHDVPIGLLLSDDLLFTSRITGTARDLGLAVKVARTPAALESLAQTHAPRCVILNLSNPGLVVEDTVGRLREASPAVFVVAYGSHVDTATLRAARAAGCDVVLPRSRFVEDLPRLLPCWFAGQEAPRSS
jgi:DNA-binding NarL/FixJ family response regulator